MIPTYIVYWLPHDYGLLTYCELLIAIAAALQQPGRYDVIGQPDDVSVCRAIFIQWRRLCCKTNIVSDNKLMT